MYGLYKKILQFFEVYIGNACDNIVLPIEVHAVVKQIILPSAYRNTVTFGVFGLLLFSKQKQDAPSLAVIHK